jgi:predicted transcriptional regulator
MAVETNLTELAAVIVASFVANNTMTAAEVPDFIASTHAALARIDADRTNAEAMQKPAVPIEESVAYEYIVCLNDGRRLRALKRYLQRKYSLSPDQYRRKWVLPNDYRMVAPAYSELRAKIAKKMPHDSRRKPRTRRFDGA